MSAAHELVTERLVLRPWALEEAAEFHQVWGDGRVVFWGPSPSLARSRWILERLILRGAGRPWPRRWFAARRRDDGVLVGSVCLQPDPRDPAETEIGWHLAYDAWGRGYATEAGRALIDAAFAEPTLARVIAAILPSNARSLAVAARLGFRRYAQDVPRSGWLHDLFEVRRPAGR